MSKKVLYGNWARLQMFRGVRKLYKAVKVTYGPIGGDVVLDREFGGPTVTHDGVTVAEAIELPHTRRSLGQRAGASIVQVGASRLNKKVGDGTSTVTVLAYGGFKAALVRSFFGAPLQSMKKSLLASGEEVIRLLDEIKEDIDDPKRLAEVATISAGDPVIGELIADVFIKVGKEGVVNVEEGKGLEITSEIVEGFTFDRGYVSNFFITDKEKQETVFENPTIIVVDGTVTESKKILPLITRLIEAERSNIVLIADDIEGEALTELVTAKINGFSIVAVKSPSFGDNRKDVMDDLAVLTGGKVVTKEAGHDFDTIDVANIGTADKIIVGKFSTTIIGGAGNTAPRIKELGSQIKRGITGYDIETLKNRQAALAGKVAIIHVGGSTETEIEELKYRIDDAVAATKAALSDGIVPGGGVTLLYIAGQLKGKTIGDKIMKSALSLPFKVLVQNAGLNHWHKRRLVKSYNFGYGINLKSGRLVHMKTAGIIDPVMVTKESVRTAVSLVANLSTLGALVVEQPVKEIE